MQSPTDVKAGEKLRAATRYIRSNGARLASNDVAELVVAALSGVQRLHPTDMALCTGALLDTLRAIPLHDTLYRAEDGNVYVGGKKSNPEVINSLATSASAARKNFAFRMIRRKVEFAAMVMMRKAGDTHDLVFAKAALWFAQEVDKALANLAGEPEHSSSETDE